MKYRATLNKFCRLGDRLVEFLGKKEKRRFDNTTPKTGVSVAPGQLLHGTYDNYVAEKEGDLASLRAAFDLRLACTQASVAIKQAVFRANVESGVHDLMCRATALQAEIAMMREVVQGRERFLNEAEFKNYVSTGDASSWSEDRAGERPIYDHAAVVKRIRELQREINRTRDRAAELNNTTQLEMELDDTVAEELGL